MCGSPLPSLSSAFTPLWRLGRIEEFRPLRRATADRGGSDELLKKLEQNFQTDNAKRFDKSKFEKSIKKRAVVEEELLNVFIIYVRCGDICFCRKSCGGSCRLSHRYTGGHYANCRKGISVGRERFACG